MQTIHLSNEQHVSSYIVLSCRGHNFPVWDVASSPYGFYFASASADKTARVWCTERATPLRILAGEYMLHALAWRHVTACPTQIEAVFTPMLLV